MRKDMPTRSCWACNKQYTPKDREIYCSRRCTEKEKAKWEESQLALVRREGYAQSASERMLGRRAGGNCSRIVEHLKPLVLSL
jgi:hypothetical protein